MAVETECSADRPFIVGEETLLLEALKESKRRNPGPATSPLPLASCIFKVPEALRRHNLKAYEPDVVLIGPLHPLGDEKFQRMETVKQWYLYTLLNRMDISFEEFMERINKETKGIIEFEKQAREFYAEPLDHLTQSKFIEIMILDGCFVIQLLWKIANGERDDDDPILNMDCMFQYVCHDLLLLENQLPWFVLSCLYRLTFGKLYGGPPFSVILLHAFRSQNSLKKCFDSYLQDLDELGDKVDENRADDNRALHILDLIRASIVFTFKPFEPSSTNDKKCLWWFAEKEEKEIGLEIPPATALSEAGVKFERGSDNNLMNIEFKNGVLTIPELAVGELTEPLFRNLIAFEQCYHRRPNQITSYAIFMDKLISSDEDIKLLSDKKIIGNWLNVEDGSNFFNRLYIDTTVKDKEFLYHKHCAELNKHYDADWNKYFEQFRRDYCSTPWKVIALTVGILILVVQLLQFIISVQSSTLFKGIRINELSADI